MTANLANVHCLRCHWEGHRMPAGVGKPCPKCHSTRITLVRFAARAGVRPQIAPVWHSDPRKTLRCRPCFDAHMDPRTSVRLCAECKRRQLVRAAGRSAKPRRAIASEATV